MSTHVSYPYCLFVTPVTGGDKVDKFEFQLPLFPPTSLIRKGRVFACNRPADESLNQFFDRLSTNINTHFAKNTGTVKLIKTTQMQLIRGGDPLASTMTLKEAFSDEEEKNLQEPQLCIKMEKENEVMLLYFDVSQRPAIIRRMSLDLLPQVECPFIPFLDAVNLCLKQSVFQWFVSKSPTRDLEDADWSAEPTFTGYVFTPKPEHVGRFVRLRVMPHDAAGRPGIPFGAFTAMPATSADDDSSNSFPGQFVECKKSVVHAPKQELHHARYHETEQRANGEAGEFRLVSYNLLAFMYSVTESARNFYFRHCPPRYLEPDYRFPLLFRELLKYQADVLCLQEVDTSNFWGYLAPLLKYEGNFHGVHLPKLLIDVPDGITAIPPPDTPYPRKAEGPAIFYNINRFRLVQKFEVDSLMAAATEFNDLSAKMELLATELPIWYSMRARAQGLVACLLEDKLVEGESNGRRLLVVCTHLYFQPKADKLRQVQCAAVRRIVRKLAMDCATEVDGNRIPVPIFIGGDLNTEPGSGPYNYLVSELGDEVESRDNQKEAPLTFYSAYDDIPSDTTFTNLVPGFKAVLDVVLFTKTTVDGREPSWRVKRKLAVPTEADIFEAGRKALAEDASLERPVCPENEGGLTLPNSQFPSDHLALVVDFLHE